MVVAEEQTTTSPARQRRWHQQATLVVLLILGLGMLQGWYGPTDSGDVVGGDATQYLDCMRAILRGDFRSAMNPLWSQGYPLLMAALRPIFPAGMVGDWWVTRAAALLVFCFCMAAFAYLLATLESIIRKSQNSGGRDPIFWLSGAAIFVSFEICLGHLSRVSPDEWISGIFFLGCAILLRLARRPTLARAAVFGAVLGIGFIVKSIFLPLGCLGLAILAVALWLRVRKILPILPAAVVFAAFVLTYGTLLSHATGYSTFGESGSLNYAWHVNRLTKWVHWEGGNQPPDAAWPQARLARFAQWTTRPPDFGSPIHPSQIVHPLAGSAPAIYVFREPVLSTYVPYYDCAYWYQGYKHLFRWRYQIIAIGKNLIDLIKGLLAQPVLYAVLAALWLLRKQTRDRKLWTVLAWSALAIAIYVQVHLEVRYLSGFLAVLALTALAPLLTAPDKLRRAILTLLLLGTGVQLVKEQRIVWSRAVHRWNYQDNVEWRIAEAVQRAGVPRGTQIGMISWTPNLHCDWAFFSGLRINSEIASPADENAFWNLDESGRSQVMQSFHSAGAQAVFSWEGPPSKAAPGWTRLGATPIWMYRF